MTDWKPVTRQELLDALNQFKVRDDNAVSDARYGDRGIEGRIAFLDGRLTDVMILLSQTVRYLTIDRTEGK